MRSLWLITLTLLVSLVVVTIATTSEGKRQGSVTPGTEMPKWIKQGPSRKPLTASKYTQVKDVQSHYEPEGGYVQSKEDAKRAARINELLREAAVRKVKEHALAKHEEVDPASILAAEAPYLESPVLVNKSIDAGNKTMTSTHERRENRRWANAKDTLIMEKAKKQQAQEKQTKEIESLRNKMLLAEENEKRDKQMASRVQKAHFDIAHQYVHKAVQKQKKKGAISYGDANTKDVKADWRAYWDKFKLKSSQEKQKKLDAKLIKYKGKLTGAKEKRRKFLLKRLKETMAKKRREERVKAKQLKRKLDKRKPAPHIFCIRWIGHGANRWCPEWSHPCTAFEDTNVYKHCIRWGKKKLVCKQRGTTGICTQFYPRCARMIGRGTKAQRCIKFAPYPPPPKPKPKPKPTEIACFQEHTKFWRDQKRNNFRLWVLCEVRPRYIKGQGFFVYSEIGTKRKVTIPPRPFKQLCTDPTGPHWNPEREKRRHIVRYLRCKSRPKFYKNTNRPMIYVVQNRAWYAERKAKKAKRAAAKQAKIRERQGKKTAVVNAEKTKKSNAAKLKADRARAAADKRRKRQEKAGKARERKTKARNARKLKKERDGKAVKRKEKASKEKANKNRIALARAAQLKRAQAAKRRAAAEKAAKARPPPRSRRRRRRR